MQEGQRHMTTLLRKWHSDVREEEEEEEADGNFQEIPTNSIDTNTANGTSNILNCNTAQDIEMGEIEKGDTYGLLFANGSNKSESIEKKSEQKSKWLKVRKKKEAYKGALIFMVL